VPVRNFRIFLIVFLACCFASVRADLRWDAIRKEYNAKRGETNAVLVFVGTNISSSPIEIRSVSTSCHCTIPRLATLPFIVPAGSNVRMPIDVDVAVKWGVLNKVVTVVTSEGTDVLEVKVNLPEPTPRERNQTAAFVDRQAVFKNDCASCHRDPGVGKRGEALYKTVCAICHDSEHRAEMVPALANLKHPNDASYWQQILKVGKPGTFMPAFSKPFGGPLEPEQLESLVPYLLEKFPSKP
jgi:mono/diheme cytochrome c family protein